MSKIPLYAVVDETVALARRHCSLFFAKFVNALLRKVKFELPKGNQPENLSIRFSFPQFFIERLVDEYGLEETLQILEAENLPGITMARLRDKNNEGYASLPLVVDSPFPIYRIENVREISESSSYYIQNATPATLIGNMCKELKGSPESILDLCASPGGKSLAIHDTFPNAKLYANDVSEDKLRRLRENFDRYGVEAIVSCSRGEDFSSDEKFDVVIVDAPCSNSGVLNKRPEARWRLSKEALNEITQLQMNLLKNACKLLNHTGELWYLTCSILREENEWILESFCKEEGFHVKRMETILPNKEGWDGGFAAVLSRISKV